MSRLSLHSKFDPLLIEHLAAYLTENERPYTWMAKKMEVAPITIARYLQKKTPLNKRRKQQIFDILGKDFVAKYKLAQKQYALTLDGFLATF